MRYLITGVNGQLGHDVVQELLSRKVDLKDIYGLDINEMDITSEKSVLEVFNRIKPDVVVHCAAYTKVDKAEEDKKMCELVNVVGTKNIVNAAKNFDSKLVYISTDYVFDGKSDIPYKEDDKKNPLSVYGETKLKGEIAVSNYSKHFIFRTAWVFGINGNNFIKTMLKLSETHNEITVVDDQIGSPTYTRDLSKLICDAIETDRYGTYHATNEGYTSWASFAKYIFEIEKCGTKVIPVSTDEYIKKMPQQAMRPKKSMLDKSKLEKVGFNRLPDWQDATNRYIDELKNKESVDDKSNARKRDL